MIHATSWPCYKHIDRYNGTLESIGYLARGENGITGRRYFRNLTSNYMTSSLQILRATPEIATSLSRLACRSKAHWGYSDDFMRAAENELSVSAADIESNHIHYYVVFVDQTLAGFYSLEDQQGDLIELGAMFVDPGFIGTGTGRALMGHAKTTAAALGAKRLIIQSDPNAESFYKAAGGRKTGSRESESIPGRFLPVLEIALGGDKDEY